jgi:RNA polymerase sigma factor (sigma-70 family)
VGEVSTIETTDGDSDREFLLACQAGDLQAFSALYSRHASTVMRYAWSRTGDRNQAEDVLQDTFATAWARIRSSTIVDQSLLPWLLAICANHLRNHARRALKHRSLALTEVADRAEHDTDTMSAITGALNLLSAKDRRVCELCLVDGLSYREAADRLGSTTASVRNRLHRARAAMRDSLADDER